MFDYKNSYYSGELSYKRGIRKGVVMMAVLERLDVYLKQNKIDYKTFKHPEVYTAQEIAAALHVPGKELAKVVMVKAKERFIMAVIPASWRVDFSKLKDMLKEKDIRLATEDEFKALFPDCEAGAEPPFGNLYNIETIVDMSITDDEHIFFNAGNHYETIEMNYKDFASLVRPKVADFAVHLH